MNHILLDLEPFTLVESKTRRGQRARWDRGDEPRWVQQIRGMQFKTCVKDIAATCAMLSIEHGCKFAHPELWSILYDSECDGIYKQSGNRTFGLRCLVLFDQRGNLHNDKGPAFVSGEVKFYYLHGIELDEYWVMTPAEELDTRLILEEPNVDRRRELIRKKGIEQMLDGLFHRAIDRKGDYTLYQVMLGDNARTACNFLKMLNPSIGVWHMEGVPNNIRTVDAALSWRNKNWFVNAEDIT